MAAPYELDLGNRWEHKFLQLAESYGWTGQSQSWHCASVQAIDDSGEWKSYIGPDARIWNSEVMYEVEVKHKTPTNTGYFGLKEKRALDFVAIRATLPAWDTILYVIHNWSSVGKFSELSRMEDWWYADIADLMEQGPDERSVLTETDKNGNEYPTPCLYFDVKRFRPIARILENNEQMWVRPTGGVLGKVQGGVPDDDPF